MIENILTAKRTKTSVKIALKSLISAALILMAVGLPQIVHLFAGAEGGIRWLPMYLPVLMGGCLLGSAWTMGVAVMSPLISYALTSLWGNPMPVAHRLPFMIAELCVFSLVSGLFSKKIYSDKWLAFPAVLLASVAGRIVFIALVAVCQSITTLSVTVVWQQIQIGLVGSVLQAVVVPFIIMLVAVIDDKKKIL